MSQIYFFTPSEVAKAFVDIVAMLLPERKYFHHAKYQTTGRRERITEYLQWRELNGMADITDFEELQASMREWEVTCMAGSQAGSRTPQGSVQGLDTTALLSNA